MKAAWPLSRKAAEKNQKEITINTITKIAIVAALVLAVATVIALKQKPAPSASQPPTRPGSATTAVTGTNLPCLVDLGADRCPACKMLVPVLDELKKEYDGRLQVEFIDVWKNEEAGKQYGVQRIPTQIFLDAAGKELWRHEGFISKEDILAKWKEFGVDLQEK